MDFQNEPGLTGLKRILPPRDFPRETSNARSSSERRAEGSSAPRSSQDTVEIKSDDNTRSGSKLTEQDQKEVEKLEKRDAEVRTHEQQHKSAGGGITGAIQLEYQVGPDGEQYAVGGEVSVDTSKEETPEATIQKAQQIQRAALAPAEPSNQDRAAASKAQRMEAEARLDLNEESRENAGISDPTVDEDGETEEAENPKNDIPAVIRSERTPEDTIKSADQIQRAALYSGEVTASDRLAATTARRLEAEARLELLVKSQNVEVTLPGQLNTEEVELPIEKVKNNEQVDILISKLSENSDKSSDQKSEDTPHIDLVA
ncbi:MAG: putative metalloprotease CJM1_0395 family protein [Candidatus Hinthialibacter antarcticus]|nr:putative metalloprotease CJM1_0395 family protein [Candidatus Hinthialibacter antarcticus]